MGLPSVSKKRREMFKHRALGSAPLRGGDKEQRRRKKGQGGKKKTRQTRCYRSLDNKCFENKTDVI